MEEYVQMPTSSHKPVLIVGGSGFVGARAAAALRRLHPQLRIAIGGRDMSKAEAVAAGLGHASAVPVDLTRTDLGQPENAGYSAVVAFPMACPMSAYRPASTRSARK
jgi:NAD(P)-dependent dehydrogenase (short-subunit alcohol dehydrogenase family)